MPQTDHLAILTWLDTLFGRFEIDYWVFGGWAVDFHAGAVTRRHDDVDVAVWQKDAARIFTLLQERGWTCVTEQDGYVVYEHGEVRVEFAFLARDREGTVYTPLELGRAFWPEHAFADDVAELGDRRIRVISLAALKAEKSELYDDPLVEAKNSADLSTLSSIR